MTTNKDQKIVLKKGDSATRYPKAFKLSILAELESGLSRRELVLKYGMTLGTLGNWVRTLGSPDLQSHRAQITDQQKREAARAIMEGRMTNKEVRLMYHIADGKSVKAWIKKYKQENVDLARSTQLPDMQDSNTNGQSVLQELSNARLKIAALETMIDIAEQQFKISIRKKPGAKQF